MKPDKRELALAVFACHRISGLAPACQLFLELQEDGLDLLSLDLAATRGSQESMVVAYIRSFKNVQAATGKKGLTIESPDEVKKLFYGFAEVVGDRRKKR